MTSNFVSIRWDQFLTESIAAQPHVEVPPSLEGIPSEDFPHAQHEMPSNFSLVPPEYLRTNEEFPDLVDQAKQMTLDYLWSPEFKRRLLDKAPEGMDPMEWAAHIDDEMQILERNLQELPVFLSWVPKEARMMQAYYTAHPSPHLVYNKGAFYSRCKEFDGEEKKDCFKLTGGYMVAASYTDDEIITVLKHELIHWLQTEGVGAVSKEDAPDKVIGAQEKDLHKLIDWRVFGGRRDLAPNPSEDNFNLGQAAYQKKGADLFGYGWYRQPGDDPSPTGMEFPVFWLTAYSGAAGSAVKGVDAPWIRESLLAHIYVLLQEARKEMENYGLQLNDLCALPPEEKWKLPQNVKYLLLAIKCDDAEADAAFDRIAARDVQPEPETAGVPV